jgi:hypothetical protein
MFWMTPTLLGPLERVNLNHWTNIFKQNLTDSDDGVYNSESLEFWTLSIVFGTLDDGQSPEPQ